MNSKDWRMFGFFFQNLSDFLSALNSHINHPQQLGEQSRTSGLGITGLHQPPVTLRQRQGQSKLNK